MPGRPMTAAELADYLEAKALLDRRSLNPEVWETFLQALAPYSDAEVVDLGTGTGAMMRRLALAASNPDMVLTGVEREAALVEVAIDRCRVALTSADWNCRAVEEGFEAERSEYRRRFRFVRADCLEFEPDAPCRAVCAHTFMDLVPPARILAHVAAWLAPGGLLYATCNYDAGTTLFPAHSDPALEAELLACYDRSMENRRWQGEATGGAYSGRRLHGALAAGGWRILAYGSSDWNLTPIRDGYRDDDAGVLAALLEMIHGEGRSSGQFSERKLTHWRRERLDQLRSGRLGLIIHQLDMLAARP